jgi:hypothetical protein
MPATFTVEQANRALPLVRRIVEDLVRDHARWREMIAACDSLAASSDERSQARAAELQREIQKIAGEIDSYLKELEAIGVQCKGEFDDGLVDFPARLGDRDVLLCWRIGEASVQFWHELDAGFAGRQPIVAEVVK